MSWIYALPSAVQITAQLFSGFLVPGFVGVLFKHWQYVTRQAWTQLAHLIELDTTGLESVLDLLSLFVLLALAGIGVRFRRQTRVAPLRAIVQQKSGLQRRLFILGMAVVVFTFVAIFSSPAVATKSAEVGGRWGPTLFSVLYYGVTFCLVYVAMEFLLTFSQSETSDRLEEERKRRYYSASHILLCLGLLGNAAVPAAMLFALDSYFYVRVVAPGSTQLPPWIFEFWILNGLGLWLIHLRFGFPSTKSLVRDAWWILRAVAVVGAGLFALMPFAWGLDLDNSLVSTIGGSALFLGTVLVSAGFMYLLNWNWRVPVVMLLIVAFFVTLDFCVTTVAAALGLPEPLRAPVN